MLRLSLIATICLALSFHAKAQDEIPEIQYFGSYKEIDHPYTPMSRLLGDVDYCQIAVDYAEGVMPGNNALLAVNLKTELDQDGDIPLEEYTFEEIIEMIDNGNLAKEVFLDHSFYIYLEPEINFKKKKFSADLHIGDQLELQTSDENFKFKKCERFNSPEIDEETVADIRKYCDEMYLFVNLTGHHSGNCLIVTPLKIVLSNSETGKYYYVYDVSDSPAPSVSSAPHFPQEEPGEENAPKPRDIELQPYFTGGDEALIRYIHKNFKIPKGVDLENLSGKMTATFTVTEDGSVTNVRFTRSLHPLLDKEAKQMLLQMPKWLPGWRNGSNVKVTYTLPLLRVRNY